MNFSIGELAWTWASQDLEPSSVIIVDYSRSFLKETISYKALWREKVITLYPNEIWKEKKDAKKPDGFINMVFSYTLPVNISYITMNFVIEPDGETKII
jgi:hypothetical protein